MRNHILSNTIYISRCVAKIFMGAFAILTTQHISSNANATDLQCVLPLLCSNIDTAGLTYDSETCQMGADGVCAADKCAATGMPQTYLIGYKIQDVGGILTSTCNPTSGVLYCTCENSYSIQCATGYYGTANPSTASIRPVSANGCVECPSGATCMGGNGSTYVCNTGYYHTPDAASGQYCTQCPSNATCMGGTETFKCNAGYYAISGTLCTACPTQSGYNGLSTTGATGINQCYMQGSSKPAWSSSSYSGTYYCSSNAYYQ